MPIVAAILIILYSSIMINGFFNSFKGKIGLVFTRNNPHEYSEKHWYFLHRVSYIYSLDPTGLAYFSKKDRRTLPEGYMTTRPIVKDG